MNTTKTQIPTVGDVVNYHGSIDYNRGMDFVVTAVRDGRLALMHPVYETSYMYRVRPESVTATGETHPVCHCKHVPAAARRETPRACSHPGCYCSNHNGNAR